MFTRSLLPTMMAALLIFFCAPLLHAAQPLDDHEALAGLKSAKVIFDVRVPDLEKLIFNLELFGETGEGLIKQGVTPEMVIAFRGPGVKFLTAGALDEEAHDLIRELHKKGVRFEACAVAIRTFKIDR